MRLGRKLATKMKAVYKQLVEKSVWAPAAFALRKNVVHDVAMNVGQSKIPSLKSVSTHAQLTVHK